MNDYFLPAALAMVGLGVFASYAINNDLIATASADPCRTYYETQIAHTDEWRIVREFSNPDGKRLRSYQTDYSTFVCGVENGQVTVTMEWRR